MYRGFITFLVFAAALAGIILYAYTNNEPKNTVTVPEVTYQEVVDANEDDTPEVDQNNEDENTQDQSEEEADQQETEEQPQEDAQAQNTVALAQFNLAVPFTSQAPHADWELPYQEACEEAALLMAHHFIQGKKGQIAPEQADREIH